MIFILAAGGFLSSSCCLFFCLFISLSWPTYNFDQSEIMMDFEQSSRGTVVLLGATVVLAASYIVKKFLTNGVSSQPPPLVPSSIPFLGHAVSFGKHPIEFLFSAYKQYGPVFSFRMVGKTFTFLVGSDAAATFFNSKNEDLNAEEVYGKLTTPVFGKGVAFDVPNEVFMEQKKILRTGLTITRFKKYVPKMQEETVEYFKRWGDSGEKDIFKALLELTLLTASSCLQGEEIRKNFEVEIAQLCRELDEGFNPMAWLLPAWLPLPSFRRRDAAHIKMKKIYYRIIAERRATSIKGEDMLQTLLDCHYKSGRGMTDEEVAGMLIAMLLAGQYTSTSASSWMCFFLAKHPNIQTALYEEQIKIFGKDLRGLDYEGLKQCDLLERTVRETLRLKPPMTSIMRVCKSPVTVNGYTIPPGHQVCVSPAMNQRLKTTWENPLKFNPDRFVDENNPSNKEKYAYVPFGAGHHRCVGESFAYLQIKSIMASVLRLYELQLVDEYFPETDFTTLIHVPINPIIQYKRRASHMD